MREEGRNENRVFNLKSTLKICVLLIRVKRIIPNTCLVQDIFTLLAPPSGFFKKNSYLLKELDTMSLLFKFYSKYIDYMCSCSIAGS